MLHFFAKRRLTALVMAVGCASFMSLATAAGGPPAKRKAAALDEFTLSDGCRIRASAAAVRQFSESSSRGSVSWAGGCESGLIGGTGVLRQEGEAVRHGRKVRYVHHYSGTAVAGRRVGRWKRESFARTEDTGTWWANVANLDFIGGVSRTSSKPVEMPIEAYSSDIRELINAAAGRSVDATAARPSGGVSTVTALRGAALSVAVVSVSASARYQTYGPEGLLGAVEPGWHAAPLAFPITLVMEFRAMVEVARIALLPQAGHVDRAPGDYVVAVSDDGIAWRDVARATGGCGNADSEQWRETVISQPLRGRFLRISILSNCGHPGLLTLRGLRLG